MLTVRMMQQSTYRLAVVLISTLEDLYWHRVKNLWDIYNRITDDLVYKAMWERKLKELYSQALFTLIVNKVVFLRKHILTRSLSVCLLICKAAPPGPRLGAVVQLAALGIQDKVDPRAILWEM